MYVKNLNTYKEHQKKNKSSKIHGLTLNCSKINLNNCDNVNWMFVAYIKVK